MCSVWLAGLLNLGAQTLRMLERQGLSHPGTLFIAACLTSCALQQCAVVVFLPHLNWFFHA